MRNAWICLCVFLALLTACAGPAATPAEPEAITAPEAAVEPETPAEPEVPEEPEAPQLPVLGNPPVPLELPLALRRNSMQASAGSVMVIAPNGDLVGWGNGEDGDLPGTIRAFPFQERRVFLENVQEVYTGYGISGALDRDGNFYVWGTAPEGLDVPAIPENPDIFPAMDQVRAADTGLSYAAAIREDGSLWLWGSNMYGKLGNGGAEDQSYPPEKRMDHAAAVLCDITETFVLTEDGDLYAFGVVGGPTPVCIGSGFIALGGSFGWGPTLLTAEGQVQTIVTPEDGERRFQVCAEEAAQLVPGGYIDRDGALWQLRTDAPPRRLADDAVDACRDGLGAVLYLSSDGLLHQLDETTGQETWSWPLEEIYP